MKRQFLLIVTLVQLTIPVVQLNAQTLFDCLDSAEKNMPLLQQRIQNNEIVKNKIENYSRNYFPALTANGQVTYQSDVPELPFRFPGTPSIDIPKDQYKLWLEVNQALFDGGTTSAMKKLEEASLQVNNQQLNVSLLEIKKLVTRNYFMVLYFTKQQKIISGTIKLLEEKEKSANSSLENGVISRNEYLKIKSEIITQQDKLDEAMNNQDIALNLLSILSGMSIKSIRSESLSIPLINKSGDGINSNPEIKLTESEIFKNKESLRMINAQRNPKLFLFGQGGYAAPNPFNVFKSESDIFYYAGVKASWNITDWGKSARERKNISLTENIINHKKEQKTIEINSRLIQLEKENNKLANSITRNEEQRTLKEEIRQNSSYQLDQGVITANQYLEDVTNEQNILTLLEAQKIQYASNSAIIEIEKGTLTR